MSTIELQQWAEAQGPALIAEIRATAEPPPPQCPNVSEELHQWGERIAPFAVALNSCDRWLAGKGLTRRGRLRIQALRTWIEREIKANPPPSATMISVSRGDDGMGVGMREVPEGRA